MSKVCFNSSKATYENAIKVQTEAYQNILYSHKQQAIKQHTFSEQNIKHFLELQL